MRRDADSLPAHLSESRCHGRRSPDACATVASCLIGRMRNPRRRPLMHLHLISKRRKNWCFDGKQTFRAAALMASASRRLPQQTEWMIPPHIAVLHFHFFFVYMHARRTPRSLLSSSHRRLQQDYSRDHYPRHHLRIAIISQQLGLFHFPSSPSSPSSLPSSSPADDMYHHLFMFEPLFISDSTLVTFQIFSSLAESGVFPPSRSKCEREHDRR